VGPASPGRGEVVGNCGEHRLPSRCEIIRRESKLFGRWQQGRGQYCGIVLSNGGGS